MVTFFDLPPETRNRIYHLHLVPSQPLVCCTSRVNSEPPILRARRQIRSESLSIFYRSNTFEFRNRATLGSWIRSLSTDERDMLHEVRLNGQTGGCEDMEDACMELAYLISEIEETTGLVIPAKILYVVLWEWNGFANETSFTNRSQKIQVT